MTKRQLATKMRTHKELVNGTSIFLTHSWIKRKQAIAERIQKKVEQNK